MRVSGVRTLLGMVAMLALGLGWSAPVSLPTPSAPASHHGHGAPHGDHCKAPSNGQCVGHPCCFSAGTATGAPESALFWVSERRPVIVSATVTPFRSAARHLLPFAQAPPVSPV
jgi:hypothetical protein